MSTDILVSFVVSFQISRYIWSSKENQMSVAFQLKPNLRTTEALSEWREGGRERAAPPSAAPGQRRLLHALGLHPGQPSRFASTRHLPPPRRQVALTSPHPRQLYSSERAPSGSAGACARGRGRRVGRLLQVPLPLVFGAGALPSACPRLRSAHESAILTAHRFVWICGRNAKQRRAAVNRAMMKN